MAKTGKLPKPASGDRKRTVDDLFQRLVHVLGVRPELARRDILKQLQDDALPIVLHIKGGVTLPVDPQSWESILLLRIRNGKLVIESGCALDYPWDAYSFSIANWSLAEELWPNPNRAKPDLSAPAHPPKVSRRDWLDGYLAAPGRKDELSASRKGIMAASRAIERLMQDDPTIDGGAYAPRVIEKRLRAERIFPPQPRR